VIKRTLLPEQHCKYTTKVLKKKVFIKKKRPKALVFLD